MKTFFLLSWIALGIPTFTSAHEAPIPANRLQLTADEGQVHLHFQSNASWWILEVLGDQIPPPTDWPQDMQNKIKIYFDAHFQLRADGHILPSRLTKLRYSEEIWHYYSGSKMDLDFYYAIPPNTHVLSGTATFYKEEKGPHALITSPLAFTTRLKTSGPHAHNQLLTLSDAEFSFPWLDVQRTSSERWKDGVMDGLFVWQWSPGLLLALLTLQLQLRTRWSKAYAPLSFIAAGLAAGLYALLKKMNSGYALGVFVILIGMMALGEWGMILYYNRLKRTSESQAAALFQSQLRFLSILTGGMTLFLL